MPPLRQGKVASPRALPLLALGLGLGGGCDLVYPEVAVVNRTAASIQLRNPTFSGCAWAAVLAYGEATTLEHCLPGADRIHFEKLELGTPSDARSDATALPVWFRYQTRSPRQVDYGEQQVFEVTADDLEQDFTLPGPYGH